MTFISDKICKGGVSKAAYSQIKPEICSFQSEPDPMSMAFGALYPSGATGDETKEEPAITFIELRHQPSVAT